MTDPEKSMLEAILHRDQAVVVVALSIVTVLSWAWIVVGSGLELSALDMTRMPRDMAMEPATWTPAYAALIFAMWWIMMMGMMLPSAAPMVLIFARISRRERNAGRSWVPTGIFAAGYIVMWGAFSIVAAGAQFVLEESGLLSGMMVTTATWLAAVLLIAAGLWQVTPIKHACLRQCRSPVGFLADHWRPGWNGSFRMGVVHGAYCLGCCWFLMALLFFGGVMNLWWIGGLALLVLIEKISPAGPLIGYGIGLVLICWGFGLLST
jgi:predicted metal-binding membrane protein